MKPLAPRKTTVGRRFAATLLVLAMQTALAQTHRFDLSAQPLDQALPQFARQAGLQLAAAPELLRGLRGQQVTGAFDVKAALAELLRGSGLQGRINEGLLTIERVSPRADAETTLPAVRVSASKEHESATGPVAGYAARRSATVTRTDTAIIEVPQSVSVVGREEIETKGMREVLDTLNYAPGVFTRSWGRDDRGYEFLTIRGFDSSTHNYLDGLSQLGFIDVGQMTEVYGMERIEMLRGPSSATFGQGDVGGIVNRISKRPSLSLPIREAQVQFGNDKYRQLAIDHGDRLGEDLAFRLVGLVRSNDDQATYPGGARARTERQYFAPSLLWQPSAATSLTLLAAAIRHGAGDDVGYVSDANGQPTSVREGDPRYSRIVHRAWSLGYELRHDVSEAWGFRQRFRYADRETGKHHVWSSLQSDGHTLTRTAAYDFGDLKQTSLDSFFEGRLQTGDVAHRLVAGVDWTRVRAREHELTGSAPDLDLLNPVYLPIPAPNTSGDVYGPNKLTSLGWYVQDQAKFAEQWLITLSGRHDTAKGQDGSSSRGETSRSTHRAWTGRAALTWLAPGGWAPYVSYGTSFQPAFGAFDALEAKPTEGRQWEAGVKYQPGNGDLLLTAAVFDLEKTNITVTHPVSGVSEQVGAVRSRGLELEAKGKLMPGLFATAAYTFNDVRGRQGNTWYVMQGKTPIQAPRQMASLWLDYTLRDSGLPGLNMGAGIRHVGKRWDDAANTKSQPGFTLFDASLRYDLGSHWRLALNVSNLFDKRYYASNVFDGWYRGEARAFAMSAAYRW